MNNRCYFEDLNVGSVFISPGRTVTEADVVNFAGLSADFNSLHMDEEYAKKTIFGGRVAHGLLGMVIASGLSTRTDLAIAMRGTTIALFGIDRWRFKLPLKIGDTVYLKIEVFDKKETANPERGIIVFKRSLINQREEVIQEGEISMLLKRRK